MDKVLDQTFRFLVAGGGTAGWLAALWLRREFPQCHITVVDSSKIGIIGAGEGTTPPVVDFLQDINVNISDLIRHCNATIKVGIRFDRWSKDLQSQYYHTFAERDPFWYYQDVRGNSGRPLFAFDDSLSHSAHRLLDFCMDNDCVPMIPRLEDDFVSLDPRHRFDTLGYYALHFDTFMLNRYLRSVGTQFQGIYRLDAIIKGCELDQAGDIAAVVLEDGRKVACDFAIDCTGHQRLLIKSLADHEWISYRKQLPVDSAFGFQRSLPSGGISTYTRALAMPAGWSWEITTQAAVRCGYVYSSQCVDKETAVDQIMAEIGSDVAIARHFQFDAGHVKQAWVRNCVAIGLSNSFIEPLEATSIWQTIMALRTFSQKLPAVLQGNDHYRELHNQDVKKDIEEIRDFVFFHYVTTRDDSDFWRHFQDRSIWPDRVRAVIEAAESGYLPNWYDQLWGQRFPMASWWEVGKGLGIWDTVRAKQLVQDLQHTREGQHHPQKWSNFQTHTGMITSSLIPHHEYLRFIKEN